MSAIAAVQERLQTIVDKLSARRHKQIEEEAANKAGQWKRYFSLCLRLSRGENVSESEITETCDAVGQTLEALQVDAEQFAKRVDAMRNERERRKLAAAVPTYEQMLVKKKFIEQRIREHKEELLRLNAEYSSGMSLISEASSHAVTGFGDIKATRPKRMAAIESRIAELELAFQGGRYWEAGGKERDDLASELAVLESQLNLVDRDISKQLANEEQH